MVALSPLLNSSGKEEPRFAHTFVAADASASRYLRGVTHQSDLSRERAEPRTRTGLQLMASTTSAEQVPWAIKKNILCQNIIIH
jgi:hypothetical protein